MAPETVVIATFDDPIEAHLARTRIEDVEIPCQLTDEGIVLAHSLLAGAVGGVKLHVLATDVERALDVLSAEPEGHLEDSMFGDDEADDDEFYDDASASPSRRELRSSRLECPSCHAEDIGFGRPFHWYWSAVLLYFGLVFVLGPRNPVTPATSLIGLFVLLHLGFLLMLLRRFPLQCKECGHAGARRSFQAVMKD